MPARRAVETDLASLLELYRASEVSAPPDSPEEIERIWKSLLTNNNTSLFVVDVGGTVVATCMLIVAPSLLRGGRKHGFLENVVTHPDCRGKGYGRAVVELALTSAWTNDCHHVLLQSGRSAESTHRFYESCGFEPGLRVGYVAHRP